MAWWWRSPDSVYFFIGVCSITRFGLFVWLGCFPSPYIAWSDWPPRGVCITGGLWYLFLSAPRPLACLIGASLLIPDHRECALYREIYLQSLTASFHSPWFGQGVFCDPLFFVFFCGAPAGRVSVVPYSLRSVVCWSFSGALASLPIVWLDA